MKIEFRNANRTDQQEMSFIAEQDSKIPLEHDPLYQWNENSVAERIGYYEKQIEKDDFFEVAVIDKKIVGFHMVKRIPYPPQKKAGVILSLWIDPSVRGNGIATQLKKRGENWARTQDLIFLQTAVHPTNLKMLSINEKDGFSVVQYNLRKRL